MILKLRNFEGSLDVNHQDKTLKLSVIPRDHNKNAVSSTKSLSGGERSYSTVAFLISLWSCVDHPFYFLDEYDVFTVGLFCVLKLNNLHMSYSLG